MTVVTGSAELGAGHHACPCCGYRTATEPTPGSYLTCRLCDWTDIPLDAECVLVDLHEAQLAFGPAGRFVGPTEQERRTEAWVVDDSPTRRKVAARIAVERQLDTAFADVDRIGGTSLRDAYRADAYGHESSYDWDDRDTHWSQIPDEVLAFFDNAASVFIYGNSISYRYYLPAYLRLALHSLSMYAERAAARKRIAELDGTYVTPRSVLSSEQRAAVRATLEYLCTYDPSPDRERLLRRLEAEE